MLAKIGTLLLGVSFYSRCDRICRATLATILGLQDRMDWKACMQTDEEDKQDAQTFKAAFAPFDFNQ